MTLVRALRAEQLKMRRTLALGLAPVAPLVIVALQIAIVIERQEYFQSQKLANAWGEYGGQTVFLWTVLMLPLFVTLETALLSNLEHSHQQWKHLFALPIPRGAIYAAKQIGAMIIIALSMASLYAYIVASGLCIKVLAPGLGFEAPVPWFTFLRTIGLSFLASWLIISIHTWISLRWHSFVLASAVGIAAIVIAVVLLQSEWSEWYPWTMPGLVANGLEEGQWPGSQLLVGSLGGLAVALLGGWDVSRRDVL